MAPEVIVDDEVYEHLKSQAEPFVDTPNTVLRRLLGLGQSTATERLPAQVAASTDASRGSEEHDPPSRTAPSTTRRRSTRTRAPRGTLLAGGEYEVPILEVLAEAGGSAPTAEVIEAVGRRLEDRLTELDQQQLFSGGLRWRSRIQFVRLRLIERGLMVKGSPPGTWAITKAGREYLATAGEGTPESRRAHSQKGGKV